MEILAILAMTGNADRHLPSLLQEKGSAIAHQGSYGGKDSQNRVAQYLQEGLLLTR